MHRSGVIAGILIWTVALSGSTQTLHSLAKDLPCLNQNFNVYVYVALSPNGATNFNVSQIEEALEATNKFFEPICLTFTLCKYDSIINYQFDNLLRPPSTLEITQQYPEEHRIVIYVSETLEETNICGEASTGGFIEIKKICGSSSLVHEMGHYFGLLHTFVGSGEENVDGSNCVTAGDGICDTPADPYIHHLATSGVVKYQAGCTFIYSGLDANGQFYQPDMGNIMSYYGCDCGFTRGQYLKMVETYYSLVNERW